MKQLTAFLSLMLLTLMPLGAVPMPDNAFDESVEEIHVSTALEFVRALRSNRVIVLENDIDFETSLDHFAEANPKELPVFREYEKADQRELQQLHNHPYLTSVFDGVQLNLRDVHDLTIRSSVGNRYLLRVQPRYAYVLRFVACSDIHLQRLVLGHTAGGYCEGGVISAEDCHDFTIDECDLYGCGMEGLHLEDTRKVRFMRSIIRDCTYQIMSLMTSEDVRFEQSLFTRNKQFDQVIISGCKGVVFSQCQLLYNSGELFSFYESEILFEDCSICHSPSEMGTQYKATFRGCTFWCSYGANHESDQQ